MARVPLIRNMRDSEAVDESKRDDLKRFFTHYVEYHRLFLNSVDADGSHASIHGVSESDLAAVDLHANWASVANSPQLADTLLHSGDVMVTGLAWCKRTKLRELMYLALSHHLGYHSLFTYHYDLSQKVGVTAKQIAHLPYYRVSDAFDAEERFVVNFTEAVLDYRVTDELFDEGRALYGTSEMVEFTAVIGYTAYKVMTYRALGAFEYRENEP